MPVYLYVCKKCEKKFEIMKPMSKCDEPQACPDCGEIAEQQMANTNWAWGVGPHWSL